MKKALKIVKIVTATVVTIILFLVILAAILEPQITRLFLQKANRSLNSKVEVKSINFSLLKSFPQASIELADITIFSPPSPSGADNQTPIDTLISAERLFISLKIPALLKKQYIIDRLSIDKGEILIREDLDGKTNLGIVKKGEKRDTSMVSIELKNIRIDDTRFRFVSQSKGVKTDLFIVRADNRLSLSTEKSQIEVSANILLNQFEKGSFKLDSLPGNIRIATQLDIDPGRVISEKTSVEILGSEIGLNFDYLRKEKSINASFNINPTDIDPIIALFNKNNSASSLINNISGMVEVSGRVNGKIASGDMPLIKGLITIKQGEVTIPGKKITLSSINATGTLDIDPDDLSGSFSLNLPSVEATFEKTDIKGSIILDNLNHPDIDMVISGDIDLTDFSKLYNNKIRTSGTVRTNIRLYGKLPSPKNIVVSDLLKLKRSISLNFNSVALELPKYGVGAEKIKGNIMISDNIWLDGITFSVDGSVMALNGMVSGFNKWVIAPESPVNLSAGLWSNRIDSKSISAIASKIKSDTLSVKKRKLFSNLSVNLDLKLDSLIIKDFSSSMVSSEISYSNSFLNISSFSLQALGGALDGNAAIARLTSGDFVGKGWVDIDRINIKKTFSVFNNFGQNHITADNLKGMLTGSINITTELNQNLKPYLDKLALSGTYTITDGELIAFEPVMKLSKFIELSELQDIRFSELKNSIVIENSSISIPSMEIKSSAFDLSLSGNHLFDGNYTYHLKLLLSDLLSKKAREKNSTISEFGTIEDDGLGKTSLYLRIDGSKSGSKVSYDIKTLKVDIKKSVTEEKASLKSILKEEYGWYDGDTLPPKQKEETRKFRIIWEEADSINMAVPPSEEKILPLKGIFRKKKGGENSNM